MSTLLGLVNPHLSLNVERESFTGCSRNAWAHMRCSLVVGEHCILMFDDSLNDFGDTGATNTLLARTWHVDVVISKDVNDT